MLTIHHLQPYKRRYITGIQITKSGLQKAYADLHKKKLEKHTVKAASVFKIKE